VSAEYVRRHYAVDYKRGDRLTVDGKPGTLVSFPGQYLGIRFDGEKFTRNAHPTWRVARIDPDADKCAQAAHAELAEQQRRLGVSS
jgi:hypothetical protein